MFYTPEPITDWFKPKSWRWKHFLSMLDFKTCLDCVKHHGTIWGMHDTVPLERQPPLHPFCQCAILPMRCIPAGEATKKKYEGADFYLKHLKTLPEYYITKNEAELLGWDRNKGNFAKVAPGKMIFGGIYRNKNKHLPDSPGRIWYEADINYTFGFHGNDRILFSNDGLIFVTYDHYKTFYEII